MKRILIFLFVACLSVAFVWRPVVPAVVEGEQISFLSFEVASPALPAEIFTPPETPEIWFEQLDERPVARCSAGYFVTSFERPPPSLA
jgi:hypothetical protein